jgi:hypothetical protein
VIGANGLSDDDDGKKDRLKGKLAESVLCRGNCFFDYTAENSHHLTRGGVSDPDPDPH